MNQAEIRKEMYKTNAASKSRNRTDNVRLQSVIRGKVYTGAAKKAVQVTSTREKSGLYEKPACGLLDSQRFLARKRKHKTVVAKGSRLRVPADASDEERAQMRRWLATADAISANLNR